MNIYLIFIGWEEIGCILDGKPRPEPGLFEKNEEPPLWAKVNLNRVGVERLRHFGDIYLALLLLSSSLYWFGGKPGRASVVL